MRTIRSRIGNIKNLIKRHKNIVFVIAILFGFSFIGISFFSVQFCDSEKEFVGGPFQRITVDDKVFFMKGIVPIYGGPIIAYNPDGTQMISSDHLGVDALYICDINNSNDDTCKIILRDSLYDHGYPYQYSENIFIKGNKDYTIEIKQTGFFCFNKKLW